MSRPGYFRRLYHAQRPAFLGIVALRRRPNCDARILEVHGHLLECKRSPAIEHTLKAHGYGDLLLKAGWDESEHPRNGDGTFRNAEAMPFSEVRRFLADHVFGKGRGAAVPSKTFVVGRLAARTVELLGQFIDGFADEHATVMVSSRSLKHTDEQRHDLLAAVVCRLPEIVSAPGAHVIHNPSRKDSAFVVYRREKADGPNALVVIEIAKNGAGTDIVNIIAAGDRQLRQFERRSAEWLEGRRSLIPAASRNPAGGEFSDVQPIGDPTIPKPDVESTKSFDERLDLLKSHLAAAGVLRA